MRRDPSGADRPPSVGALVWLLSLAAGSIDALCLLHLGGVFASVITGNLVVLAAAAVTGQVDQLTRCLAAVGSYALGVFMGSRLTAGHRVVSRPAGKPRPKAALYCLAVETTLLVGLCGGWLATQGRPLGASQPVLVTVAGAAMGLHSVAVGALGHRGLSTTYLTGALTRLVSDAGEQGWWRRLDRVQSVALLGMVLGAGIETAFLHRLSWIGPLPAALLTAGAALVSVSVRIGSSS
ncbi:MAG: YoaK family protein [Pseudonocardiaceae bacterium]